jgi:flagellar motor switch protein FliN
MSSSPTSSSSSSAPDPAATVFDGLADIVCEVWVLLGTGTVSVRRCLTLQRQSVLRLTQSAGEDLQVLANGSLIARGEVVIVEDSTAIRITDIPNAAGPDR